MGLIGQVCSDGNQEGRGTLQLAALCGGKVITDGKLLCWYRSLDSVCVCVCVLVL